MAFVSSFSMCKGGTSNKTTHSRAAIAERLCARAAEADKRRAASDVAAAKAWQEDLNHIRTSRDEDDDMMHHHSHPVMAVRPHRHVLQTYMHHAPPTSAPRTHVPVSVAETIADVSSSQSHAPSQTEVYRLAAKSTMPAAAEENNNKTTTTTSTSTADDHSQSSRSHVEDAQRPGLWKAVGRIFERVLGGAQRDGRNEQQAVGLRSNEDLVATGLTSVLLALASLR